MARSQLKRGVRRLVVTRAADRERIGLEFAQRIPSQRSTEGIAREVGEAIRSGLGSGTSVAVLIAQAGGLHVVEAVGSRSFVDASLIARLVPESEEPVVDLSRAAQVRGAEKEAQDPVCQVDRGGFPFRGLAEDPEGHPRLPIDLKPLEDLDHLLGDFRPFGVADSILLVLRIPRQYLIALAPDRVHRDPQLRQRFGRAL